MRKESAVLILCAMALVCAGDSDFFLVKTAQGASTIVVPDDYSTIQGAINGASNGDTIFVRSGTYYEHVVVNKKVTLVGEEVSTTVIDGNNTRHVIHVLSDNVTVTGLTIQRSGNVGWPALEAGICLNHSTGCFIIGNRLIDNGFCGISLLYSQQNIISSNIVARPSWVGVHLLASSYNVVFNNTVDSAYGGISGHASSHYNNFTDNTVTNSTYGMFFNDATHNRISRNSISNITAEGIWLQEQVNYNTVSENNLTNCGVGIKLLGPNHSNVVSGNFVADCQSGIALRYSDYTQIYRNSLSQNGYGFYMEYSARNTIWGNNIVDNSQQAYMLAGSGNSWDCGYPMGGNYWSNYGGSDQFGGPFQNMTGSDGIGDTPYTVNALNVDHYPLMQPVLIILPGDVNGDGKVDGRDIAIIAKYFGSTSGFPPNADITKDGKIDGRDIAVAAKNFGKII